MARRAILGLLLVVGVLGLGASSAGAHAQLVATAPVQGAVVEQSPPEVVLEFNEPVEVSLGGIRVYDAEADRVDGAGEITHPGGANTVATALPELPDGTYVVTYRVVSADSHPIEGAFTFQVGAGTPTADTTALVDQLLVADGSDQVAGALQTVVRAMVFLGVAGFVGSLGFALLVSPTALSSRSGRRLLSGSWVLLVLASAASIGLQGVTAAELPLGDAFDPSVWSAVVDTRFGLLALLRLVLLLVAGTALVIVVRRSPEGGNDQGVEPGWWRELAAVTGVAVTFSIALGGHAGVGSGVAAWATIDAAHLAAMAVWLGGLVLLATAVLTDRADAPAGVDLGVVDRFSTVAFASVVVLVLTGSLQSWRQVGSLDALTTTTFGRVLMLKVFIVLVLLGIAAFSRSILRDMRRAGRPTPELVSHGPGAMAADVDSDRRQLRGSVIGEVAIGVLVIAVSAVLVNLVPARDALSEPYSTVVAAQELRVEVVADPARAGPVDFHFYVFSGGSEPVDVEDLTAQLRLDAEAIGPLELSLQRAGPNHFSAYEADVPIAGDWELTMSIRTGEFEVVRATTILPIE